jgi:hypothetical protein
MKTYFTPLFVVLLIVAAAQGNADDIRGRWKVYTTLVTAYDAVNPDYVPGDRRLETWRIAVAGRRAVLRTPAGAIRGARVGNAWVFDQTYPIYPPVSATFHLVARLRGAVLRGTIEVRYYDDRFGPGYILGNDAWTFRGTRR